ncbi:hypothetical protein D3C81_1508460 [compost metagenome]
MPAAVVEIIQLALVRQGQRLQITQFVIAVLQQPSAVGLAKQLPRRVVGKLKLLLLADVISEGNGQRIISRVVVILGAAIFGQLAQ